MGQWPVYFLLFFIAFADLEEYSASVSTNERNVGSVLFDKSTSCNHCWTKEELVILSSRKAFQNLLPETNTSAMQSDRYIADLLEFVATCLEYICKMSVGKSKHLILRSFADTIGGYLTSYVGPVTKVAFYAGNVKYRNVKRIHELVAELKDFLRTNGAGWAQAERVEMFVNVTPIAVPDKDAGACDKLVVNSASESRRGKRERGWRRSERRSNRGSDEEDDNPEARHARGPFVYLPYFDNDFAPNSIALPFKDHNLWSLFEEDSVAILAKYYETCVQCIKSRQDHKVILAEFDREFNQWLLQSVYPRLSDDKWYPAFGGVLKIIAFLKGDDKGKIMPSVHKQGSLKADGSRKGSPDAFSTWQLVLIAVATAALVWLLVGLTLVCYKCHQSDSGASRSCESLDTDSRGNFCEPSNCPRLNRRNVSDRVRDWWRRRFDCPETRAGHDKEQHSAVGVCRSKESVRTHVGRRVYKKRKKSRRSVSISGSPCSSRYAYYENKQFHYSSDMSSSNSDDSSYR